MRNNLISFLRKLMPDDNCGVANSKLQLIRIISKHNATITPYLLEYALTRRRDKVRWNDVYIPLIGYLIPAMLCFYVAFLFPVPRMFNFAIGMFVGTLLYFRVTIYSVYLRTERLLYMAASQLAAEAQFGQTKILPFRTALRPHPTSVSLPPAEEPKSVSPVPAEERVAEPTSEAPVPVKGPTSGSPVTVEEPAAETTSEAPDAESAQMPEPPEPELQPVPAPVQPALQPAPLATQPPAELVPESAAAPETSVPAHVQPAPVPEAAISKPAEEAPAEPDPIPGKGSIPTILLNELIKKEAKRPNVYAGDTHQTLQYYSTILNCQLKNILNKARNYQSRKSIVLHSENARTTHLKYLETLLQHYKAIGDDASFAIAESLKQHIEILPITRH